MPDYKDLLKNGWHPEKSGTSIKGSVKSLVGRGDDKNKYEHHTPRPLSSLQDPASFAPPPKRTNTGSISLQEQQQAAGEEEERERPKPPKPWSLNTTGLSTANLPPPPARRDVPSRPSSTSSTGGLGGPPPPPARSSPGVGQNPRAPPPALPPRLPPRSPAGGTNALDNLTKSISAASINNDPTVPKPNQGAMGRLAAAGVNVPGLGIGTASHPPPPPQPPRTSSPSSSSPYTGLAKAGLNHYRSSAPEQKASLRNAAANSLTQQPQNSTTQSSSPHTSLAKAGLNRYNNSAPEQKTALQSAAKTGYHRYQSATPEQKAAVQNAASSAVRGGLERYNSAATAPEQKAGVSGAATSMFSAAIAAKKKPPPPPPPAKKPQFLVGRNNTGEDGDAPPPIPLGTRPF
ncbi:uncharacterized protein QC764_710120 [Podospora pseudoanserina]|uniref:Uncharacterized protein n=1 Tax=Podospora pseudoanserina TaxID=2609844 RepID=A0ABR0HLF5_9PEZI|nr:hypothetical protein QC764_710120 [Podospora pseudoanserina]